MTLTFKADLDKVRMNQTACHTSILM